MYPNPCYILHEDKLRANLSLIKSVSERANCEIILAFKAFALWKSFPIFREYINHTTASSLYEARLAKEEFGSLAHTYSPAYTDEEIDEIVSCSSHLTFNSLSQYDRFKDRCKGVSIGLRVNPEYSEIETELYNPCAPGSRFGILADELEKRFPTSALSGEAEELPVDGFHIHCHCESGSDVFARTLVHIEEKFSKWFSKIKWINFGGGHLMTRKDYDVELLINTLNDFHKRYPNLKVILEPGSAFGWQTGPLHSKVVDIVENKGIKTAILNVSFTCHMPDCLEMPYWPKVRGAETLEGVNPIEAVKENLTEGIKENLTEGVKDKSIETEATKDRSIEIIKDKESESAEKHIYRLGGNSCLSGDWMESWLFDHPLQIGEEIIFEDMCHYTTVKTCMFNGINHPSIGLQHSDGTFELLRKYTYEDYRDRMD